MSSTLRDRAFPGLNVSGEMLFSAREYPSKGHLGLVCALAAEITGTRGQPAFCQDASGHEFVAGTTRPPLCAATNGGYFVCPFDRPFDPVMGA